MAGRQVADVVFCLDASGSMGPCFGALRDHVQSFVGGLQSGGQSPWDLRLEFVAYNAGEAPSGGVFGFRTCRQQNMDVFNMLYHRPTQTSSDPFFTKATREFSEALQKVDVGGDEATFVALDTALDLPWRESAACHRVVILMTDEALETGIYVREQVSKIPDLIEKLHALRVKLFIVGPSSDAFDALSAADRSEYQLLQQAHDGLQQADFKQLLGEIGKSVSVSTLQNVAAPPRAKRALFGQNTWTGSNTAITGD